VLVVVLLFAAWAKELPTKVVDKTAADRTSIDAIVNSLAIVGCRFLCEKLFLFSKSITLILCRLPFWLYIVNRSKPNYLDISETNTIVL